MTCTDTSSPTRRAAAAPASVAAQLGLKVRRVVMFHHDPLHSDGQLEAMLARAHELWGEDRDDLILAYEGMELEIT